MKKLSASSLLAGVAVMLAACTLAAATADGARAKPTATLKVTTFKDKAVYTYDPAAGVLREKCTIRGRMTVKNAALDDLVTGKTYITAYVDSRYTVDVLDGDLRDVHGTSDWIYVYLKACDKDPSGYTYVQAADLSPFGTVLTDAQRISFAKTAHGFVMEFALTAGYGATYGSMGLGGVLGQKVGYYGAASDLLAEEGVPPQSVIGQGEVWVTLNPGDGSAQTDVRAGGKLWLPTQLMATGPDAAGAGSRVCNVVGVDKKPKAE